MQIYISNLSLSNKYAANLGTKIDRDILTQFYRFGTMKSDRIFCWNSYTKYRN